MIFLPKTQALIRLFASIADFLSGIFRQQSLPSVTGPIEAATPVLAPPAEPHCVNGAHLSGDELSALLDRLFPANDDAKNPTIAEGENHGETPARPGVSDIVTGVCAVASPNPSFPLPTDTRRTSIAERLNAGRWSPLHPLLGQAEGTFKPSTFSPAVPWSRSTPAEKFAQAIRSAQSRKAVAISCNLSPAREQAVLAADNPTEFLNTYISRAMREKLGRVLPYAFQFEFNDMGRLHIHGVVLLDRATDAELATLKEALATGCGKISGHAGSRQIKLKELYDADGWSGYFDKTGARTVKRLGRKRITYVSAELRAYAEADWTAAHTLDRAAPLAA